MWNLHKRIENILRGQSKCRFFYIDRDNDWRFKKPWYEGKKLKDFWDYELEHFMDGFDDYKDELPYQTKKNVDMIIKEFELYGGYYN